MKLVTLFILCSILILSIVVVYTYTNESVNLVKDKSLLCEERQIPDLQNLQKGTTEKIYYDACLYEKNKTLRRLP